MVRAERHRRKAEHQRADAEHAARERAERDKESIAAFAATLQQTLLPPALPAGPWTETGLPLPSIIAGGCRENFYDVFSLVACRWGFFLGNVCGKGAAVAALTSLARYTLRAAAHDRPDDPTGVLAALNAALLTGPLVEGLFCTALHGVLEAAGDVAVTVALAGGGHPPALYLTSDRDGVGCSRSSCQVGR